MKILLVCMGNICRSPTAEGVLRRLLADRPELGIEVDSAGTHAYHIGEPPDPRAHSAAAARGIDLGAMRARLVADEDFERFDVILAMDRDNLGLLRGRSPPACHERIRLFMEFAGERAPRDVPDPYYGGAHSFERVLDLIEEAAAGLIEAIAAGRLPVPR